LTQEHSGTTRAVHVGDEITVELAENPTTGHRWQPDVDTDRLECTGDEYDGAQRPVGSGGRRRLTFVARRPGRARLHLVNRRPWEQTAVDDYDVTLDVTE
jgi:inhibitor of cysteine peptidase